MKRAESGAPQLERSFAVSNALLVLGVISVILIFGHFSMSNRLERSLEAQAMSVARSIGAVATPSLLSYNYGALQVAAEGASDHPDIIYVLIHDKEGNVAGVAGVSEQLVLGADKEGRLGSRKNIRHLTLSNGERVQALEVSTDVLVDGVLEPWGSVRVGIDHRLVSEELSRLELGLIVLGLLLSAAAVVCAKFMARRIAAPLKALALGTEAVAKGDMSRRIPVSGARELAELAHAFNVMMDRVTEKADESQAYQSKLAQFNATLEQLVRERTRALEESERQYRTLVEHSPESILIVQEWQVRFVNPSFLDTFGLKETEVLAPEFCLDSIFEPGSAELVRKRVNGWLLDESPSPAEVLARDRDGNVRTLELRGSRINYLGEPAAECLLVDMTEARRLREELEDSDRLRSLGELSSGVAHDFNNLIGAILGRTQLLRHRGVPTDIDAELAVIEQAALDGRETVLRIQEFSRTRTDRTFTRIDLREVIAGALEITRARWESDARRRNIAIEIDRDVQEVPPMQGNPAELREVFTNLMLNAIDAMPDGGTLRIATECDGPLIRAVVEDTGQGMCEETRRRMFDPFFSTKGMAGIGMGLSVAYGIVKRHGGSIEVVSRVGNGARFVLEFPIDAVVETDEAPATTDRGTDVRGPARVLVIDDEPTIADLLRDTLAVMGHSVDTANGGREGLDLALAGDYDLVMTDLGMPGISGWDVARELAEKISDLPIMLVTGWGASLTEEEIAASGVAAVVHKPFELKPLLAKVAEVLEASARRSRANVTAKI